MGYLTSEQIEFFHQNGYLLIPNFWTSDVIESLRSEIKVIISQLNLTETRSIFTTRDNMDTMNRDRYFLESGDVIRFGNSLLFS
jgi:phytanoyl-CoA hydroxylase